MAGGGIAQLKAAGIEVISGVRQAEAAQQNRAFLRRLLHRPPLGAVEVGHEPRWPHGPAQWRQPMDQQPAGPPLGASTARGR